VITHPRTNRVTPFGEVEAVPSKGLFLGNRGDIHALDGSLSNRRWAVKAWICCALTSKSGSRVEFDRKGTYYPLFFADEVTAFAAGHRPCAMCRYQDYQNFKRRWQRARGIEPGQFVSAADIDRELHASRVDASRRKIIFPARLGDLPDGAMVTFPEASAEARLLWRGRTWRWHHSGYDDPQAASGDSSVSVLTPAPFIEVFKVGYAPVIHPSVR
jgi:hypothetical protein